MADRLEGNPIELIEDAWRIRREAFDAPPAEKEIAYTKVTRGLSRAASICRNLNDQATLAIALRRLGHAYLDVGKHEEARALMAQAVVAAEESRDPALVAHTVRHLGDVELDVERFEEAEKLYDEALALYRKLDDPPTLDLANALRPMAILKGKVGDKEASRRLWAEARELYAKVGIGEGVDEGLPD